MNKITAILVAGSLLMLQSTAAISAEGWYVGAGMGLSNLDTDTAGVDASGSGFSFSDRDFGYKLFGGYQFNKYLGLEGGYTNLGGVEQVIDLTTPVKLDEVDGYNANVLGLLPIGQHLEVFGKLGMIAWEADLKGFSPTMADDGTDLVYGIGVQGSDSEHIRARLEFEVFDLDEFDEVWLVSASVLYQF